MKRLMLWIIDHQGISLALIAVATVLLLTQALRLEIDVGVQTLIVKDSPEWAYYEEIKERFGTDNLTAVVVSADTIFAAPALQAVERLTNSIEQLDGVTRVDSLTSVNSIKGEEDWVDTGPLIDGEVPTAPAEIERLRVDALANPILVGNIISADARAAGLLVYADEDMDDKLFDRRLAAALEDLIEQERQRSGLNIYQIGQPYIRASLTEHTLRDQKLLLPVALVVLIVVLYGLFRTPEAAVIPMTTSLLSVGWAFGWMGLLGYTVNILSGVLPVLLICVGFTEDVHLISEYQRLRRQGQPTLDALRTTIDELANPLLVTSLTTAVGFASLSISDIEILRQLGHIVPLGFASNLLITMVLVPAMLCAWPDRERGGQATGSERGGLPFESLLDRISRFNLSHRDAVLWGGAALLLVGAVGGPSLQADNDLLQFFRPSSPLRQRAEAIHEELAGALTFNVVVEANEMDGAKQPTFLGHVAALQDLLESHPDVDKTVSITDYVRTMHHQMNGGDDAFAVIPDSPELIAQYLTLLHDDDVSRFIDYDYASASISVRHNLASTAEMDLFLDDLERFARAELPDALAVHPTGENILLGNAADYLATNMVAGLAYTVVVVTIINAVFFMSIKAGLLSLVPNLLPVAFIVGLMGLLGVSLNVGTAMIAAVAVGIAIDDTVHYMARNSMELDRGHDQAAAMFGTLAAEGRAIVTTSIGLTAGFSVLVLSSFTPIAHFGAMSAIVIIVAVLVDLTLTPVLMASTRLVTLWNIVLMKLDRELLETPLFRNLNHWQARKVVLLGMLTKLGHGEYAIREGDRDDTLYMVVTGRLHVSRYAGDHERVLATLCPGDVYGEMAFVGKMARTANVIAEQDSEVLRLGAADLGRLRRRFPRTALKIFENISGLLSARLRDATRGAVGAQEEDAA